MGYGGYGQAAHGRSQLGSASSAVEPRFEVSQPVDGQRDVPRNQWLTFQVYYYSSVPDIYGDTFSVEIRSCTGRTASGMPALRHAGTRR